MVRKPGEGKLKIKFKIPGTGKIPVPVKPGESKCRDGEGGEPGAESGEAELRYHVKIVTVEVNGREMYAFPVYRYSIQFGKLKIVERWESEAGIKFKTEIPSVGAGIIADPGILDAQYLHARYAQVNIREIVGQRWSTYIGCHSRFGGYAKCHGNIVMAVTQCVQPYGADQVELIINGGVFNSDGKITARSLQVERCQIGSRHQRQSELNGAEYRKFQQVP